MNGRATLANLAWLGASVPAHQRFMRALRSPAETQERWLRAHLRRHSGTAYGRAHGCNELRSYAEFARRVPVVGYDELEPWINRIRLGDSAVLTAEPVTRLLPTSGSTGARKLIPFTAGLQREFNAAIGPWMVELARQYPKLPFGPAYWSVTPAGPSAREEPSAVPIGFEEDSRYLGGARAALIDAAMAVPSHVRRIGDVATFRRTVLLHLLRHRDLRLVSVWHPSFLSLLLETLTREWDDLLATLAVERGFACARQLRTADPQDPFTIWPALQVVSCWGDAHAAGPAADLQQRLAGIVVQPKGLLATEAFVTVPFGGARPLAVCSHFYEFADDTGRVHLAEGLRLGQTYEVIVTTAGGLWRYQLGDRVEVDGFVGRTPSLRFLGRDGVSDRCGEKLTETFVGTVLSRQCPASRFSMLAPESHEGAWRYVLYLEPGIGSYATATECLDNALQENPHYALCRRLGQLGAPRIAVLSTGGYERYIEAEMVRGRRLGDIKPVALSRHGDWARYLDSAGARQE